MVRHRQVRTLPTGEQTEEGMDACTSSSRRYAAAGAVVLNCRPVSLESAMARGVEETVARMANKHYVERFFDWYNRLAGDRRVVAFSEAERDGERWVIAYCKNYRACDKLFDALWDQG